MKRADLLQSQPWVTHLPNWQLTDPVALPAIISDFAEPTDGKESPWGRAQLVFAYDSKKLPTPPSSATALAQFIENNPGRFTFPQPPDFVGVSFLKQVLIELTNSHPSLYGPVDDADFDAVTAPLWDWLDAAKPNLWRRVQPIHKIIQCYDNCLAMVKLISPWHLTRQMPLRHCPRRIAR